MTSAHTRKTEKAENGPRGPYYLDNPKAAGAPAGSRWGYLPCGCTHNGHGGHVR